MSDDELSGDGRLASEDQPISDDPDLLALRDAMRDIVAAEGSFELELGS
jgi:hypothetical protein